jgi:hypothetical protein
LTYQWYVGTSGDTSQPVTGATAPSYTTPVLTANRSYWVSVSNSAGTANSNTATITVNPAASSTTLTASPNPSVAGQAVTLTATVTAGATGTITFLDSTTPVGAATVNNGAATLSTSQLSVGSHNLTAAYSGDAGFTASTSIVVPLTVNLITTSTTLSASPNPSVTGQTVTLTATVAPVSPGAGTPSGSVIFKDGATTLGSVALANGTATLSTSSLAIGPHSLVASYGGGGNFAASDSTAVGQTVHLISTTTAVTTSVNPSRFGQSITFTVTVGPVAPGTGTPTGSVTFQDGSNPIGTANLSAGAATLATSSLPAGSHSISAVYAGAGNFAGSTSSTVTQTVNKASTTNVFTSNLNPSVYGQSVTLKAVLSALAPGAGTPTGAVTFKDGSTTVGTATLAGGAAVTSISTLTGGSHSLTAVYNGDNNFDVSTSAIVNQTVNKASTTTSLNVTPTSSVFGQPVTLNATISSSSVNMTGTVTFKDGATTIGTASVSGGVATLSVSNLSPTFHLLSAAYGGDTNYSGNASSTVINLVSQASTTSRVASSANPSVFGQSVTLAATVSPVAPSIATPTGSVTFRDGLSTLGTVNLSGGAASFTTSSLSVGSHSITVVYNDDTNFNSSTSPSLTQVVNKAATSSVVTSSLNPSNFGQTVTFTATVSALSPGAGTPAGNVIFRDGTTTLGTVSLVNGKATLSTGSLSRASHTITAAYQGNTNYSTSTSPALTQTVR